MRVVCAVACNLCACVCVCARARARARVCVCVCVCVFSDYFQAMSLTRPIFAFAVYVPSSACKCEHNIIRQIISALFKERN